MADEREATRGTKHKKKKRKTSKRNPVTYTKPVIRKDKALITKFHAIKEMQETVKKNVRLSSEEKCVKLLELNSKLDKLGGMEAYQQASKLGEKRYGGFNSAKWVLRKLKENNVRALKDQLRLLDVGALMNNYSKQRSWIDCTPIDLNPLNNTVIKADFLQLDPNTVIYDIVVLSLVVNFEGDPRKRGQMLKLCTKIITENGFLFVVLPLPCVMNSRFFSKQLFLSMTESLGFEASAQHCSRRLYFAMLKNTGKSNPKPFPRKIIRRGDGHNNFSIIL